MKKIKYPAEVQERVDFLAQYKVNEDLETCHIMHLYAEGLAYPNGYYDSQFFTLVIYDTLKMQKREIQSRDGIDIATKKAGVKMVRIFADGSTLVKFDKTVAISVHQAVVVFDE